MATAGTYRVKGRTARSRETRGRIMRATRDLLDSGDFHQASVEEVADRAGVSRATVYQHFPSRLDLVDAVCESFEDNESLARAKAAVDLPNLDEALDETIANAVGFWSSEDGLLAQLYGAASVDPAARDFVERQRSDRRKSMQTLARRLAESDRLRAGVDRAEALAQVMFLTSYGTYRELRQEGLSDKRVIEFLQASARRLLAR
jgi:AcrR family transcriptional regulator